MAKTSSASWHPGQAAPSTKTAAARAIWSRTVAAAFSASPDSIASTMSECRLTSMFSARRHLPPPPPPRRTHRRAGDPRRTGHQVPHLAALRHRRPAARSSASTNTQKRLPAPSRAHTIAELQYQLDDFLAYSNRIRRPGGCHHILEAFGTPSEPLPRLPHCPRITGYATTIHAAGVITIVTTATHTTSGCPNTCAAPTSSC